MPNIKFEIHQQVTAEARLADAQQASAAAAAEARALAERVLECEKHDEELRDREATLASRLRALEAREQQLQVAEASSALDTSNSACAVVVEL